MDESMRKVGAITLFVDDPQRSKDYYERVFGATTIYEDEDAAAFGFENMVVNTLRRQEADELIAPAAVAGTGAPAAFQLTAASTIRTQSARSWRTVASTS